MRRRLTFQTIKLAKNVFCGMYKTLYKHLSAGIFPLFSAAKVSSTVFFFLTVFSSPRNITNKDTVTDKIEPESSSFAADLLPGTP